MRRVRDGFWWRYAFALIVTIAALGAMYAAGAYLKRRRGGASAARGRAIVVEETIALAPSAYASLVRVGDRRWLIGVTAGGVTVLASLACANASHSLRSG